MFSVLLFMFHKFTSNQGSIRAGLRGLFALTFTALFSLFTTSVLAANVTFDFEGSLTGDNSQSISYTKNGYTIQANSTSDFLGGASTAGGTSIGGSESLFSAVHYLGETSVTFSLSGGYQFDLTSIRFGEFIGNAETVTIMGSNGHSLQFSVSAGSTGQTFNVAADANAARLQGITSFTITASPSNFYLIFDDITLQNISTTPGAPTGVSGVAGNGQVSLSWSAPASDGGSAITGYNVQVATSSGGSYSNAAGGCAPATTNGTVAVSCVATGLSNGTSYFFKVAAINSVGTSSYSVASSGVTPATVPGAPTIGIASAGDAQATVAFNAPGSNGGAAISSYMATASPGSQTGGCAASPCTVTGLTNGTAYTFTVTATNAAGTGSASAASNSVTPKTSQTITFNNPGSQSFGTTPTLTANSSSGLTVSFSSSSTGVCTITSGGALTFVSAGSCTIAADQAGNGTYAAAATVSKNFQVNPVVPGAPTIGTAAPGDAQAAVSFSAPAYTGGDTITGYTVTSNPGGRTGTGASSPITVAGLTNGTAYTFTVTATNTAGTGLASAASNSVTPKASQTITFNNPGNQNFGTTPTLTATSSSNLTVSFSSSTAGVCTITSGGLLTFFSTGSCIISADQAGNGAYLAATTVPRTFQVVAVAPGAPNMGTASPGDSSATVTFSAPAFTGGSTINNYTVTSNPGGLTGTGTSSPITVAALTNGTAYTFTVTATNAAGTGSASAASNSVTPAPGPSVVSVAVPANGTYGVNQNLDFTVTWDSNVTVTGTPRIAITLDTGGTVQANYLSSPTGTTNLFRYTVQAGQSDNNGITVGALSLNGGTIRNSSGTDATLTLNSVASTTNVLVNTAVGTCGTASGVTSAFTPAQNLCSVGSATSVTGNSTSWNWFCNGGGGNASCSAPKQSTPTSTGKAFASIATTNNWVLDTANTAGFIALTGDPKSPSLAPPAGVTFPHGLLDFKLIAGTANSSASVTINYPSALPAGVVYWKFGPEPGNPTLHWYQFPGAVISSDRMSITLTIQDGAQGDSDLATPSSITDPGGPGVAGSDAVGVPTLSSWALLGLSGLIGLATLSERHRRRRVPSKGRV